MTLVGTVLQKLANMQLFTHQEMPYLELNPLLEGQFEAYKAFIEAAITVPVSNTTMTINGPPHEYKGHS